MSTALTVQDVEQLNATTLKLIHRKLTSLPQGLSKLTCLTSIDASENLIHNVSASELPPTLKELSLTGCQLTAVPPSLAALSKLQHIQLSANTITQADALFQYPYLIHAGLGYNHISSISVGRSKSPARPSAPNSQAGSASSPKASCSGQTSPVKRASQAPSANQSSAGSGRTDLPAPHPLSTAKQLPATTGSCSPSRIPSSEGGIVTKSSPSATPSSNQGLPAASSLCRSPLMSLDLSHNDVTDLPAVLSQLKQLSQLKSLSLKGNPASLLPDYHDMVLQQLPQLIYLDGQKLCGISTGSSSRPGSSSATKRRPGSAAPTAAGKTQQEVLTEAFSNLLSPSALGPAAVPLLLQLHRIQLVESPERVFAELAELAAKKQQEVQLQQQAEAAAAAAACMSGSVSGSTSGSKSNSSSGGAKAVSSSAADPAAAAAAAAAIEVPLPLLKPISYHLQTSLPDDAMDMTLAAARGSQVCSTALIIQPPAVAPDKAALAAAEDATATAAAAAAGKKGAKPGSKAAATAAKSDTKPVSAKGKPGARGVKGRATVDDAVLAPPQQLVPGALKVLLELPVTVAGRDWVRQGFIVQLVRTHYEPDIFLQPLASDPAADPSLSAAANVTAAAAATASKMAQSAAAKAPVGGKQPAAASSVPATAADPQPAMSWQYSMKQQVLGTAMIAAVDLLESGSSPEQPQITAEGTAEFAPPAPLFDRKTGTLMLLKEAAAGLKPIGSCRYRIILHYSSPPA